MFDVYYIGQNKKIQENFPFAKCINSSDQANPKTKMYWLVEPNIDVIDLEILDFRPEDHDMIYEHIWKWDNKNYGGLKLIPTKKNDGRKYINKIACKKSFDILHTKTPNKYFENNPYATHVWCVDKDYKLDDDIDWAPDNFEPDFIHSFHLRGQLEHKYPAQEGGIKLYPKDWKSANIKYHGFLDANVLYPILYVKDVNDYSQRDILNDDYVWIIDKEYKIEPKTVDWVPNPFEDTMIHAFKMPYQLGEKYPLAMGGIRLVPKDWKNAETKIHPSCSIEDENYDIFYIDEDDFTADNYTEYAERSKTEWFWIVDREFDFNGKLSFVPAEHEREYIHVFKIPEHLEERYPKDFTDPWDNRCGGVRLVHKEFDFTKHKYQLGVCPVKFDIFYTNNLTDYETFARKSRTKMFWLIDEEHELDNIFNFVPHRYDQKTIHIFKIANQLGHKYPRSVTNVSDNRCGGVKLVPTKYQNSELKFITNSPTGSKQYPIIFVNDVDDYSIVTQDCWLIDKEYQFDEEVDWTPPDFQKNMIHTFHLGNQLRHKYPEEIGGIRWIPKNHKDAETVIHQIAPFEDLEFEKFSTEEEGRANSKNNWFWVVDSDVEVHEDFDFDFVPDVWDEGKTHVWQKLNPITGRQYDYGGVMLCPKVAQTKGRPKYIREPACTQREYPVYHLQPNDYKDGLNDVYVRLAHQSNSDMYWVIDAFTQLHKDFDFSYYPTQWDRKNVHVWQNEDSTYRNVRLIPKETFMEKEYTDKEIANNSFKNLKQINTIASQRPTWPVIHLQSLEKNEFINAIKDIETPFVWTVDPDVKVDQDVLDKGFMPLITDVNKIHTWQKVNPRSDRVHGYGGLRLWPTQNDYINITSDQLKLNKFRNLQYVKDVGSTSIPYEIFCISFKEDILEVDKNIQRVTSKKMKHGWVNHIRGVKGIFEAHKACAKDCKTDMFWVIDADAEVTEEFMFDYIPDVYDKEVVHVWGSKNPVNGLEYGYGGVKLFPTEMVRQATSWGIDFTTGLSSRFKSMPEVSCITRFNTDAFSTWRSAFRECVKLTLNNDEESKERLRVWMNTKGEGEFSDEAVNGALEGNRYALKNKDNLSMLDKINDFEWLEEQWKA
tara:strand:+ start:2622 stop:5939 length:3318 start_codon:yes stop_codon:yes gene_type:complete